VMGDIFIFVLVLGGCYEMLKGGGGVLEYLEVELQKKNCSSYL
ncbi:MAG: hypothetical protein ACI8WT_002459, partial [Clostridium sp.]